MKMRPSLFKFSPSAFILGALFLTLQHLHPSNSFAVKSQSRSCRAREEQGIYSSTPTPNADWESDPMPGSSSKAPRSFQESWASVPSGVRIAAIGPLAFYSAKAVASTESTEQFPSSPSFPPSSSSSSLPLGDSAYTVLGQGSTSVPLCKVLNGMWQVSGAHGYEPDLESAVSEMTRLSSEGYTTFDLADIYGPAEDYVGAFRNGRVSSSVSKDCQYFTKWVPRPEKITRQVTEEAIARSLSRMKVDQIDLLQFHWWDYGNRYYYDAMSNLMSLRQDGLIKNIGLTNFDTDHMLDLIEEDAPIVSNQVSFSVLDTRPLEKMVKVCKDKDVKLLCYGTLLGGFLSAGWLGKPEPEFKRLANVSLRKYLPWINAWGGWGLFQELLTVLDVIGKKHGVSLSNVAVRWVLDQEAVGGAIVGVRLGLRQHAEDNRKIFSFSLDEEDKAAIAAVQGKSQNLIGIFGDCGGEYRRRA